MTNQRSGVKKQQSFKPKAGSKNSQVTKATAGSKKSSENKAADFRPTSEYKEAKKGGKDERADNLSSFVSQAWGDDKVSTSSADDPKTKANPVSESQDGDFAAAFGESSKSDKPSKPSTSLFDQLSAQHNNQEATKAKPPKSTVSSVPQESAKQETSLPPSPPISDVEAIPVFVTPEREPEPYVAKQRPAGPPEGRPGLTTAEGSKMFSMGSGDPLPQGEAAPQRELAEAHSEGVYEERRDGIIEPATAEYTEAVLQGDQSKAPRPAPVTAEDGSARAKYMHMIEGRGNHPSFIDGVADIGKAEGFGVELQGDGDSPVENSNVNATASSGISEWAEDLGEYHTDGTVSSVSHPQVTDDYVASTQFADRVERLYDKKLPVGLDSKAAAEKLKSDYPDAHFGLQGRVATDGLRGSASMDAQAQETGRESRQQTSYLEGGNLLAGQDAEGKPYALVGKDSIPLTQEKLKKKLGRDVSPEEARKALAHDTGVAESQLTTVEQPGDFHLDMQMSSVKPGEIALNDSSAALKQAASWATESLEKMRPKALPEGASPEQRTKHVEETQRFEAMQESLKERVETLQESADKESRLQNLTAQDLTGGGFEVHRMAGVFPSLDVQNGDESINLSPEMNFMNSEQGTGKDGERFSIMLGGDPRAEKMAAEKLSELSGGDISRMYFLDREFTSEALSRNGGINCLIKMEGE